MDWMTLSIEILLTGIFCVWVVIPIGEYRTIYLRLRRERQMQKQAGGQPEQRL
jgi:hypothetical protein